MGSGKLEALLKGLCVGGTMMVPGISGGSMAMILGVYDKLISSVSSFVKDKKRSFIFLILFSLGGGIGMLLFAKPLLLLIQNYERPMMYFFIGIVAGSIPMIYRKAEVTKISISTFLYPLVGISTVFLLGRIPSDIFQSGNGGSIQLFFMLVLAGFISAIALVLPGISVSYMLLLLGLYDKIIDAVSRLYLPFLIPLGLGLAIGVLGTTKLLERMMTKHPKATYLMILGFILGSLGELLPGLPKGTDWIPCTACLVAGTGIIRIILQASES